MVDQRIDHLWFDGYEWSKMYRPAGSSDGVMRRIIIPTHLIESVYTTKEI
jgi:hypothetical protein